MTLGLIALDRLVTQPETVHHAGSEILDDDVGVRGEFQKYPSGLFLFEVEGEASLIAID